MRFVKKILLCVGSVVLSAIVMEAGVRVVLDFPYSLTEAWMEMMQYHERLGWGSRANLVHEGRRITNSGGWRGPEFLYDKRPGVKRVLLLGDSFAFGFGHDNTEEVFSTLMERSLANTEVVNLGVTAYGTDQEYLLFQMEGIRYKPDVVILMFCPNDFAQNILVYQNGLVSPNYESAGDDIKLTNVPVPIVPGWGPGWIKPTTIREWIFVKSRLSQIWNRFLVKRLPRLPIQNNAWPTRAIVERSSITSTIIRKLQKAVTASGADFIVVTIPYLEMVSEEDWQATKAQLWLSEQDRIGPYEHFFDPLEKEGIKVVHLNRRFVKLEQEGTHTYEHSHKHWNKTGHVEVAKMMVQIAQPCLNR